MSSKTSLEKDENLVDITDLMTSCASALSVQEPFLCRKETFQLQDAMAATQLMDPKMDSCEVPAKFVLPSRHTAADDKDDQTNSERIMFPRPCPESLSDPFVPLPWNELTLEQTSVIVLHQLVRLQALFSGASVGESVFTCLYAHKTIVCEMQQYFMDAMSSSSSSSFDAKCLFERGCADMNFCAKLSVFASTCVIVEITELFRSIVINADIYEEEDFVSNTHDMPFFLFEDKNLLRQYLDTTVELLSHLIANDKVVDDEHRNHHIQTLQLSLTFLNGLAVFCSKMGKLRQVGLLETVDSMQQLACSLREGLQSLRDLVEFDEKCSNQQSLQEQKFLVAQAFDSYVNRPLFGNTPVRQVTFVSVVESIARLITLTEELDHAVCAILTHGTSLTRISRMLRRFCSASILARSLIVLNLYFDELLLGQHELHPLIVAHMQEWEHLPSELIQNEHAQAFLSRLAKPIYDTLKLHVSNRNRQRAYIEAAMFEEWTSLQNEANLIDTQYRREYQLNNTTPPFFGLFVLSVLLRLMEQYLACGIEVGLCWGYDEICAVFWYRDFLLAALYQNLTQMRQGKELYQQAKAHVEAQQQQQQKALETPVHTTGNKGKGKKKNSKHKTNSNSPATTTTTSKLPPPVQPSPPPPSVTTSVADLEHGVELRVLEVQRMLCRGIVRFLVALKQSQLLDLPDLEFTSRQTIFERRYAVFQTIRHPPALTFEDYVEGSNGSNISVTDLCQSASVIFKSCRSLVDSILADLSSTSHAKNNNNNNTRNRASCPVLESEARSLLKVCVGNSVYLMKLTQLVRTPKGAPPPKATIEFDFGAHQEFCIIKVL